MEKENILSLYFNMIFGAIGTIFIALAVIRYPMRFKFDIVWTPITLLGLSLTVNYINYLEKKALISNKLTWMRAVVSITILLCSFYFLLK